jgi:hypothetical protein
LIEERSGRIFEKDFQKMESEFVRCSGTRGPCERNFQSDSCLHVSAATFADANWMSMGGISGADGAVMAESVDGAGNLYIGGNFVVFGDTIANHIGYT